MKVVLFQDKEIKDVNQLLNYILMNNDFISTNEILSEIKLFSDELPKRIRQEFYDFKLKENTLSLCLRGFPLDQNKIGLTPTCIPSPEDKKIATREEVLHFLFATLLGEIFTWSSIQNGNIINEVIPIKEHEDKPISSGANYYLDLHTEDAFHPYSGDYLGLLCIRNPTQTPITLTSLSNINFDENLKKILFENRFRIGVNIAHNIPKASEFSAILFGNFENPYIRLNLNNIGTENNDIEAKHALDKLTHLLKANQTNFIPEPGDLIYIDNFRVVHAREQFVPKYDGHDRWLKRLYITNDLRKSRDIRHSSSSRVIDISEQPD